MWLFFCYAPGVSVIQMDKTDYFSKVIKVVTELMDVTEDSILGRSRESEVVDARWMAICLMKEKGYSSKQIAPLMNHPIRTVNHALNGFSDRVKYSYNNLGNILATARQQLRE